MLRFVPMYMQTNVLPTNEILNMHQMGEIEFYNESETKQKFIMKNTQIC